MAQNKITFEMGLIHDAEVLRALENFQKVIGSIGDTSKTFGDKLGAAGKDLTDLAKYSAAAAKEFKLLDSGLNDVQKTMTQGLLDERKLGRLDSVRQTIKGITEETRKLAQENTELKRQEDFARQGGQAAHADKLHQQRMDNADKIAENAKESTRQGKIANPTFTDKLFGPEGMFPGGQINMGNILKAVGPEAMLMGGAGAATATALSIYKGSFGPAAAERMRIDVLNNKYRAAQETIAGNDLTTYLRATGADTYGSKGYLSGTLDYMAQMALHPLDSLGALSRGQLHDYSKSQIQMQTDALDKQRFDFLGAANETRTRLANDNVVIDRAVGSEQREYAQRWAMKAGYRPEDYAAAQAGIFKYQGRMISPQTDFDLIQSGRMLNFSDETQTEIARRYQNNTAQGVKEYREANANAGLGLADVAAKNALDAYFATKSQATGFGPSAFSQAGNITANMGGESISKIETVQGATTFVEAQTKTGQNSGSGRNMLLMSKLIGLGLSPELANMFIQMGVENNKDIQAQVDKAIGRPGSGATAKAIHGAEEAANKFITQQFGSARDKQQLGRVGKAGGQFGEHTMQEVAEATAVVGNSDPKQILAYLDRNAPGPAGRSVPTKPGGDISKPTLADTQAAASAETIATAMDNIQDISDNIIDIGISVNQMKQKILGQAAEVQKRQDQSAHPVTTPPVNPNVIHGGHSMH